MNPERRQQDRIVLPLEARWEDRSVRHPARLSNLSTGGCYLESPEQALEGARIRFEVELPVRRWMQLSGEVVRQDPTVGFSIRFTNLSIAEQSALAQVIDYARGV